MNFAAKDDLTDKSATIKNKFRNINRKNKKSKIHFV